MLGGVKIGVSPDGAHQLIVCSLTHRLVTREGVVAAPWQPRVAAEVTWLGPVKRFRGWVGVRVGVSLLIPSRCCTSACEHENCASKHTSTAALRSTGPGPPPSRLSSSEQPRAELVAAGWNVPWAKWYAARWNAWNASIDAVVDGVLRGDQEWGGGGAVASDVATTVNIRSQDARFAV